MGKTLKNFTTAFAQDKGDSNAPQTLPDEKDYKVIYTDTKAVEEEWINKKNEWTGKGWNINDYLSDNNGFMLTLIGSDAGNNKPAHVNIDGTMVIITFRPHIGEILILQKP